MTNIVGTDKTGALDRAEENVYDPFGKAEEGQAESKIENEIKYTGAVLDNSGVYYLSARHYDPNTGRFLQQDTYKGDPYSPWTQNLYTYTGNNPTNYVDPTGHVFKEILGTIGTMMGGPLGGVAGAIMGSFVDQILAEAIEDVPVETTTPNNGWVKFQPRETTPYATEVEAAEAASLRAKELTRQFGAEVAYGIYAVEIDGVKGWWVTDFMIGDVVTNGAAGTINYQRVINQAKAAKGYDASVLMSVGHTHVEGATDLAGNLYYDQNKARTGGLSSTTDYDIIQGRLNISKLYTSYGDELEYIDVYAARNPDPRKNQPKVVENNQWIGGVTTQYEYGIKALSRQYCDAYRHTIR